MMPYTIDGVDHRMHEFTGNATIGGATYSLPNRGGGTLNWEDAANHYASVVSYLLATATTPGTAELQELVSGSWLTRSTHAVTFPNSASSYVKASQVTMVMKDTANNLMKTVILEGAPDVPRHWNSYAALPAGPFQNFAKDFTENFVVSSAPYNWLKSGQGLFARVSPVVGLTTTFNRRMRRKRGLA
jgi:hypothetical protein